MGANFFGDPRPVVLHRKEKVPPAALAGYLNDPPLRNQRLAGVFQKRAENRPQHRRIAGERVLPLEPVANQRHGGGGVIFFPNVERRGEPLPWGKDRYLRLRRPGEQTNIGDHLVGALHLGENHRQMVAFVRCFRLLKKNLRVAADDRQRVIDFMPQAGREFGEGIEQGRIGRGFDSTGTAAIDRGGAFRGPMVLVL